MWLLSELSEYSEVLRPIAYLGIAALLGGTILRVAFTQHNKIWCRTEHTTISMPSFGKAIAMFVASVVVQLGAFIALTLMLMVSGILNFPGRGGDGALPVGLYVFAMPIEYLVAAWVIWFMSTSLTFAKSLVIAQYQLLFVIAVCLFFSLTTW